MIPSVQSATVFDTQDVSEQTIPSATWPKQEFNFSQVSQACSLLKAQTGPVIILTKNADDSVESVETASDTLVIAYPLNLSTYSGVVVLQINAKHSQQNVILQLLSWGKDWLALLLENAGTPLEKLGSGLTLSAGGVAGDILNYSLIRQLLIV